MGKKIATLGQLAVALQADPALVARVKDDPAGAIAGLAAPLQKDVWIYRPWSVRWPWRSWARLGERSFWP
jgi:hypothetical protein